MNTWESILKEVKFDEKGLVAAVALEAGSGDVLMLAYMNRDSLAMTLETGIMTYWSRSRQELWVKGKTSGNMQKVGSVKIDCDGDALLFRVQPEGTGAACHKGYRSCFFREQREGQWEICDERVFDPDDVYGKRH
ncbi:phosphoribosyl-AMP cyclohydrolase [Fibrobacterota bacterium]